MPNKCPCKDCENRTITCHGVCKKYQDWKREDAKRKEWLREQQFVPSVRLKKNEAENIKLRSRGWRKKRVKDYD